ncbi:MAG: DUF2182 domain-containing protein [Microlunatus sp.]
MSTVDHRPRTTAPSVDRAVVVAAVTLVAATAWVLMAIGHDYQWPQDGTPPAHSYAADKAGHHGHGHGAALTPSFSTALHRLSGWAVMVLAMMLPPALPLLHTIRAVTRRRSGSWLLTTLAATAFTVPWLAAGLLLVGIDATLGPTTPAAQWVQRNLQLVAGLAVVAAGLYQFTPLKHACLSACRSPRQLALMHWHGLAPANDVLQIGIRYGVVCVGCCWALMLLTLAVGWPAMPVMVAMTAAMAAERLLPQVRPLVPAIAFIAIALGIALLAGIVPAGQIIGGHA